MTDFRKNLIDRVIMMFGFESPFTIRFADSCECYTESPSAEIFDKCLKDLVEYYENNPEKIPDILACY